MNLYLIERPDLGGYDTYDSAVVQAESEEEARKTHPKVGGEIKLRAYKDRSWVEPEDVKVTFIGTATPSLNLPRVICASFNAG